jgi:hypothetical protein
MEFTCSQEVEMHRTMVGLFLAMMVSTPAVQAEEVRYFEVQKGDRPHVRAGGIAVFRYANAPKTSAHRRLSYALIQR